MCFVVEHSAANPGFNSQGECLKQVLLISLVSSALSLGLHSAELRTLKNLFTGLKDYHYFFPVFN